MRVACLNSSSEVQQQALHVLKTGRTSEVNKVQACGTDGGDPILHSLGLHNAGEHAVGP